MSAPSWVGGVGPVDDYEAPTRGGKWRRATGRSEGAVVRQSPSLGKGVEEGCEAGVDGEREASPAAPCHLPLPVPKVAPRAALAMAHVG